METKRDKSHRARNNRPIVDFRSKKNMAGRQRGTPCKRMDPWNANGAVDN